MAHYMAINKSGKNLPIFSGWPSVDKGNQIGTIYNREAFIYSDTEDGVEVYFRNSSGRIVQGFYYATDANGNDLFSSNTEAMKALSPCIDYRLIQQLLMERNTIRSSSAEMKRSILHLALLGVLLPPVWKLLVAQTQWETLIRIGS